MFTPSLSAAIIAAARAAALDPAALLALIEVETNGAPFEADGRTPQLLYERHVAWRQAAKTSRVLQARLAAAGLAIPKWSRATQYKDQGSSANRLQLIAQARGIDEEVANQSASWGLGQTMGFLFDELGFSSACEMVDHMTGSIGGQLECLMRELHNKRLVGPLNAQQWPTVARLYNGPGYAANRYDARLADAYKRWGRKLASGVDAHPARGLSSDELRAVQRRLRELGYAGAGQPDGLPGPKTVGALAAFQAHEGLPVTGKVDAATLEALHQAQPIEPARDRKLASVAELKAAGSKTIVAADRVSLLGKAKIALGSACGGGAALEQTGLLDIAQGGVDKANQVKGLWQSVSELLEPWLAHPAILLAAGVLLLTGLLTIAAAELVRKRRLADHRSGDHAGPLEA